MAEREPNDGKPEAPDGGVVQDSVGALKPYTRKAGNWLNGWLAYTKESESPDNYHIWCALSTLSAAVKRNLWLDQGMYVLFPNLYVALVGPPARTAKSTALYLAKQVAGATGTIKFGPDSCTREQLIQVMEGSKLNNQCAIALWSTEFSSIIGPSGILMIQFLLDIYDCNYTDPQGWKYETKHQGKAAIVNPYLAGLFCTTPDYLVESMPDNIIGHGFTSRVIFVHEERERLQNPRPAKTDDLLGAALVSDLRHISRLSGQFQWTDEGAKAYDTFYHGLYQNIPEDHRIEGYHWRKKIHVLKVAMLLAVAEGDSLILDKREIDTAVQLLHGIEHNMARVFRSVGKYEYTTDIERVGAYVHNHKKVLLEDVFRKFYHLGVENLSQVIELLKRSNAIKIEVDPKTHKEIVKAVGEELPWQ